MPQLLAPIVGARFRPPAPQVLALLGQEQELELLREPENPYDYNAIQVLLPAGWEGFAAELDDPDSVDPSSPLHLGYVPKEIAAQWAPVFDEVGKVPKCHLGFDASGRPCVVVVIAEEEGE